jgi:hypothetical protein
MSSMTNVFKAALTASCLMIAACGGNGPADSLSSSGSKDAVPSLMEAGPAGTASPNGTTIPSATRITDGSGNIWTVADGVIYENAALAGYSSDVTLLVYDNDTIYQENAAKGWWSWNGSTWVSGTDPRKSPSPAGTSVPSAMQITDGSGDVWAVSGGVIYENGALAGYSKNVTLLLYDNQIVYQENTAGGWWSWNGSTWVSSGDPRSAPTSPSGTTIPSAKQITDSSGNVWTVSGGVIYENTALAGYSSGVALLLYDNNIIYQENTAKGWWSWNGSMWVPSGDPRVVTAGAPPTISGSPPTSAAVGEAYSFVPATTAGGGKLAFAIANMPPWASFSTLTGALTGTPSSAQTGAYPDILISVSNGSASASLAPFSITVTTGSASLSWTAPTENTNGTPLTNLAGYTIYYGTSPGELTQTIQVADPGATSYVVGNLSAGTYYFSVAAYTAIATQSAESEVASKTVL